MDRRRFLRVLGQDPARWAERFGIEPYSGPCGRCGRELATTIPFFYKQLRGLMAPRCECGYEGTPYCVVRDPRFGDLFDGPLS